MRRLLLLVHVLAAMAWMSAVAALAALEWLTLSWSTPGLDTAAAWASVALLPVAAGTLLTGFELARRFRHRWPWVVVIRLIAASVVLLLTGALIAVDTRYVVPVRIAQLTILVVTFLLAITWKPPEEEEEDDELPLVAAPARVTGRHRK